MEKEKKYFGGWVVWLTVITIGLFAVGFGLKWAGVFGKRVIFVESHQYKESRKSEIATYNAQLTEIDRQLMNSDLDANVKTNLEAQASAIRIQLQVAKEK